jgi:hypothetical protein
MEIFSLCPKKLEYISMDKYVDQKLPKCIWGDGCLLRLSDQKHAEMYEHTTSDIPRCPLEGCSMYQKAYDFVIGPASELTPEIKKAQQHTALHYHPPIRSVSVVKERLPEKHDRRHSDTSKKQAKSVPKLNLKTISSPPEKESSSAPEIRAVLPIPSLLNSGIKSNSDPSRRMILTPQTITVSPKRRLSSSSASDPISKGLEELREDVKSNTLSMNFLRTEIKELRQDFTIIKEILINTIGDQHHQKPS